MRGLTALEELDIECPRVSEVGDRAKRVSRSISVVMVPHSPFDGGGAG